MCNLSQMALEDDRRDGIQRLFRRGMDEEFILSLGYTKEELADARCAMDNSEED